MFSISAQSRWTPIEREAWTRRAYGRKVMFETEGGTLRCVLDQDHAAGHIYLRSKITGRMLIEAYCNGVQVLDEVVSNEDLDCFIALPRSKGLGPLEIELHFIPATFGEARVPRSIEFVTHQRMISTPVASAKRAAEKTSA